MQNTQLKDNGLSRGFKLPAGYITKYQSWAAFLADACSEAGVSCDITGLRAAGVNIFGTPYAKETVLTDATAAAIGGLPADPTPNDAFAKLRSLITTAQGTADGRAQVQSSSYVGTGTYGANNPNTLTVPSWAVVVFIIGRYRNAGITYGEGAAIFIRPYESKLTEISNGTTSAFSTRQIDVYTSQNAVIHMTWDDNTLKYWAGDKVSQYNYEEAIYQVYCFG